MAMNTMTKFKLRSSSLPRRLFTCCTSSVRGVDLLRGSWCDSAHEFPLLQTVSIQALPPDPPLKNER